MIEVKVSYHPDHGTAMEKTRFWAPLALSPEEKRDVHDPIEMQRLAGELPIERAASRSIVSTDPDDHVEKIARYNRSEERSVGQGCVSTSRSGCPRQPLKKKHK